MPVIGYEATTDIAREALKSGGGYDLVLERGLMTMEELERALDPEGMVRG